MIEKNKLPKVDPVGSNYIVVEFGYSHSYVLPFSEGKTLLSALEHAETIEERYDKPTLIKNIPLGSSPKIRVISQEEYLTIKMDMLLGLAKEDKSK